MNINMEQTTINSGELSETIDRKLTRVARGAAIAAGAAASGYAAYRIIRAKRSPVKQLEHDVEEWLTDRIDTLKKDMHLGVEKAELLKSETEKWVKSGIRVAKKSLGAASAVRALLRLAIEKKFVVMKLHLHNELELKTDVEIEGLHKFYAELWAKMFPDVEVKTIVR
jgi:hypothetical protein